MDILFMGTPDFAAVSLKKLALSKHNIIAVFTQPDKTVGRKMVLTSPAVKKAAEELNIPVYQPATLRTNDACELIKNLNPELIVVAAYGKILPPEILAIPKFGCMNVHASLLPKYRGASPIQWSIVSGDTVTGVTTMQMNEGLDTGDILLTAEEEIKPEDTAADLFDRLALKGAALALKTVDAIENGTLNPVKQDENDASYAPIITKQMAEIDFSKTAREIDCLIRGFNPWPVAFTVLASGKKLKVFSAQIGENTTAEPGTVLCCKKELIIACGGGTSIKFDTVQLDGKAKMPASDLLNGLRLTKGEKINA